MASLAAYFAMGGYAGFVWAAWGLTALVMAGLVLVSWRELKSRQSELQALQDLHPGRRGRIRTGQEE
jgi:heme exporter protein D